ncbi:MAG: DegT/DnrJ/EryC1/StrS family aminotransferase [Dermatophilaceae bacterium]
MAPPRTPLFKVAMARDAAAEVEKVLSSGFIGQGPRNDAFESALAELIGTPHVVTVSSATAGLSLVLHMATTAGPHLGSYAGGPAGGEVLATPLTCTATNWPIVTRGLDLRWIDVDPATLNVSLHDLRRKIGPTTRAVVIVHWAGYPLDLDELSRVLDEAEAEHGVRPVVIEDCAHAWGSTFAGRRLGLHGNPAVYSFQAIKHLTCGDGGAVVFPTAAAAERARRLRWYGMDRNVTATERWRQDIPEAGFKFHMNDISSAIGQANLDLAERNVKVHRDNAAFYDQALRGAEGVALLERAPDRASASWIYSLRVERRDDFVRHLDAAGIDASAVHMRNDIHSCVAEHREELPGVDLADSTMVSIPVGWWVDDQTRARIADLVRQGW